MTNLLTNGTFDSDLSGWSGGIWDSGECRFEGALGSTVQFSQWDLSVTDGVEYRLTFTARGAVGGELLTAQLVRHTSSGTSVGLSQNYNLTSSNATYQTTFTCTLTESNARLRFRMTNTTNVVYIDNVVLEVVGSIVADFTGTPVSGLSPLEVDFTDASTGSPNEWSWEYSKDGGAWTEFATTQNPTYEFTQVGDYSIRLTSGDGVESDTVTKTDYIIVSGGISADFSGTPTSGAITLNVTFTDASTSTSGIDTWTWEYNRNGEGWTQFSTSQNPSYGFTQGGTYDIRLTVTGDDGSSTYTRTAYISATGGVVAGFTGTPTSGAIPLTVNFTGSSTGTITGRTWEYNRNNNGWIEFSSASNPSLNIAQPGTYDIRLTVTDGTSADTLTRSSYTDTLTRSSYIVASGSDTIIVSVIDNDGSPHFMTASYAFSNNEDYFIVASYDNTTGDAILYVNGEAVETSAIGSYELAQYGGVIEVGQRSGVLHGNVLIDELFFLDRAINPDEVRAVYESNAPVFAETSTWHWRTGRNRLWSDASGLWMVNASGTKVLGAYAGDEDNSSATYTWGGVNLAESDVLIGDASRGGYLLWDDSAATLEVQGRIVIEAGSEGYSALTDKPTTLTEISEAEALKLAGIEDNATLGADWAADVTNRPTELTDGRISTAISATGYYQRIFRGIDVISGTPSAGLNLTSTYMGYYDGSAFQTFIKNDGKFFFDGESGATIGWDGTDLFGTNGTTVQWYARASTGKFYAASGAVWLDTAGVNIDVVTLGTPTYLRFDRDSDTVGSIGFLRSEGVTPLATDGMIFNNTESTKFRFLGASQTEFDHNVSVDGFIETTGLITDGIGTDWTALSLNTGWVNFGGSYQTAEYKKVGDLVFLRGLIARTSGTATLIGTLPSGYRPILNPLFIVATNTGYGEIEINSPGQISWRTGGVGYLSLDGLIFSTTQ